MHTTMDGLDVRDVRSAAAEYLDRGLVPVPLPPQRKSPDYPGWLDLRITPEVLDEYFPPGVERNIAVLNGEPSGNTVDVDLDTAEARMAAPQMLPPTGCVFGRPSAPQSHWIYRTDTPHSAASEPYRDPDGSMLAELRGTGGLTVFPPSTHQGTGERIRWHCHVEPTQIRLADLRRAVRRLAACALLARHWPATGSRQDAALALAGGLVRAGWAPDQVEQFITGVATAAGDEEARRRIETAGRTTRQLAAGQHATGWPRLEEILGARGPEIVRLVRDWLEIASPARVSEFPITEIAEWPAPPDADTFHGLAGEIVRFIEPESEADPVAILVQILVMSGSMIGPSAHYSVESDRHHCNEFVVLVGATGKARKGVSWNHARRLACAIDMNWASRCVQTGISSGEGVIWQVRDPITKREKTSRGGVISYVEVEADPGVADKRLLIYESEFGKVLRQIDRQGNIVSAVLREAWDGTDLATLTKNNPVRATAPHISVVGHITVEEFRRYLTLTESANGYGNRHLAICVRRSRLLPDGGQVAGPAWDSLCRRLGDAVTFARSVGQMSRDGEAREIWHDVYGQLSEGKPGLAGALLARAEAHVLRLSMIYALLDCSAVIQAPHLIAALGLWEYVERSIHYVFGQSLGDPLADDLLALLRTTVHGLTRTDMTNALGRHQPSNRINQALALLLQHHLARRQTEATGGRPAERWYAASSDGN